MTFKSFFYSCYYTYPKVYLQILPATQTIPVNAYINGITRSGYMYYDSGPFQRLYTMGLMFANVIIRCIFSTVHVWLDISRFPITPVRYIGLLYNITSEILPSRYLFLISYNLTYHLPTMIYWTYHLFLFRNDSLFQSSTTSRWSLGMVPVCCNTHHISVLGLVLVYTI